jgi:hypothetical protein
VPNGAKRNATRRAKPLYRSAKISDYRFRKVLWHFVRDHTATEAARATGLSVNSAAAIFRKLRGYFTEAGLFVDYYTMGDMDAPENENLEFERRLLEFHFSRIGEKRGLAAPPDGPDYHFAESCWRFDYQVLRDQRPSDAVYAMMLVHLLEIIRLCGPVGGKPTNRKVGLMAKLRQMDQRILWLERNGPAFRGDGRRAALREIVES